MERSGGKRRSATPWLRVPKRVACSREVFEWRASCLGKVARPLVSQSPRSLDEPWVRKWKRCVWSLGRRISPRLGVCFCGVSWPCGLGGLGRMCVVWAPGSLRCPLLLSPLSVVSLIARLSRE